MAALANARFDVVIVGGGVAGLSLATALAGHTSVLLLEREAQLATHASGNNAAIYRPLEDDESSAVLAARSRQLLAEWLDREVLSCTGVVLASAEPERIAELARRASRQGVRHRVLDRAQLTTLAPSAQGGQLQAGLLLLDGGVFDVEALNAGLAQAASARGARLVTGASVARVLVTSDSDTAHPSLQKVTGVELDDGTRIETARVVLAAGAWARELGRAVSADVPLVPQRRHLMQLTSDQPPDPSAPVLWRLEDEVYFRAAADGWLASPCDQMPWAAETPPVDPARTQDLLEKLRATAPGLAGAKLSRSWACLRTFASDGELVAGPDARLPGLFWFCGLGGRGLSVSPAVAELVAAELGNPSENRVPNAFLVSRFRSSKSADRPA
jgi:D-arginine dehydrogenase